MLHIPVPTQVVDAVAARLGGRFVPGAQINWQLREAAKPVPAIPKSTARPLTDADADAVLLATDAGIRGSRLSATEKAEALDHLWAPFLARLRANR